MDTLILLILSFLILFFWGFLILLLIYMGSAIFVWPPSMPTDAKTRKAMLLVAKRHFDAGSQFKMADFGSGYGHLIRTFARYFKNAHITGFEILSLPYYFSKAIFSSNPRINIIRGDFLKANIADFDLIMTFYKDMSHDNRLSLKLKSECKKGCYIISNNFKIPGLEPLETLSIKLLIGTRNTYLYQI